MLLNLIWVEITWMWKSEKDILEYLKYTCFLPFSAQNITGTRHRK